MSKDSDVWWISPAAIDDLTIKEIEGGFNLSAPDGTECSAWLSYYNESDERRAVFTAAFVDLLTQRLNQLKEQDGHPK